MPIENEENMRAEYAQIGSNFRTLTDIRFKLLTILPISTIFAAWIATSDINRVNPLISLFGLVITSALMIYNERNDQHYNELISRAAEIEISLKLPGGQFNQRPGVWFTPIRIWIYKISVTHSQAIGWIYKASLVVWLFGVLFPICLWLFGAFVPFFLPFVKSGGAYALTSNGETPLPPYDPLPNFNVLETTNWLVTSQANALALVTAAFSFGCIWVISSKIGKKKKARKQQMRDAAYSAMEYLAGCVDLPNNHTQRKFLRALDLLAILKTDRNEKRTLIEMKKKAKYYLKDWQKVNNPPRNNTQNHESTSNDTQKKLSLQDFRGLPTNIASFILRFQRALRNTKYAIRSNPTKSQRAKKFDSTEMAFLAAELSGLPARWIMDTYTGRSGKETNWLNLEPKAIIHYSRTDNDYDGWGLSIRAINDGAQQPATLVMHTKNDDFGIIFTVPLVRALCGERKLRCIFQKDGLKNETEKRTLDFCQYDYEVWAKQGISGWLPPSQAGNSDDLNNQSAALAQDKGPVQGTT